MISRHGGRIVADDVSVKVGGDITDLTKAFEDAKTSVESFASNLTKALAIAAIEQLVESTAKAAEGLEQLSAKTGVFVVDLQRLQSVSKIATGDSNALVNAWQHMAKGGDDVDKALKALGLSNDDLKKKLPIEAIETVSRSLEKYADGMTKANLVNKIFGDDSGKMSEVVHEGAAALEETYKRVNAASTQMNQQTIGQLSNLERSWRELTNAMSVSWGSTVASISGDWMPKLLSGLAEAANQINKNIAAGVAWEKMLDGVRIGVEELWQALKNMGTLAADVFTMNWGRIQSDWEEGLKKVEAIQNAETHAMLASAQGFMSEYEKTLQPPKITLPQAPTIADDDSKERARLAMEAAMEQIRAADLAYQETVEKINAAAQVFGMKENEKTAALVSAVQARQDIEQDALQDAQDEMAEHSLLWERMNSRMTDSYKKSQNEILRYGAQMMVQQEAQWKSAADTIASSFTGQLRALIAGTETWRVAMSKIASDLIMDMINYYAKLAAEWAAHQAYMLAVGQSTQTALATQMAAAQTATLPARAASFSSQITADAAEAFAGVFAFLSPTMGPAASGPAAAAQASVLAELASVPKLAVGLDYVPQDMMAYLHKGEAVIPAEQNSPTGGSGGSGGLNFNITAMDSASVASALMNNRSALSIVLRNMQRSSPGALTSAIMRG